MFKPEWFASNAELVDALCGSALVGNHEITREQAAFVARLAAAFLRVDRGLFVPKEHAMIDGEDHTYSDMPLPIGHGQTISQPSLVALMLSVADIPHNSGARVLEVGTGSAWSTGLTAHLMGNGTLHSYDVVEEHVSAAKQNLKKIPLPQRVKIKITHASPLERFPERKRYDRIIIHAATPPAAIAVLMAHLRVGGKLLVPVGNADRQALKLYTKTTNKPREWTERTVCPWVTFVPLRGKHGLAQEKLLH